MNFFRRFFLYSSLCLFSTLLHAQEKNLLQKAYHPSFTTSYVRDFINEIKKQTGIYISFSSSLLDANKQVSITGNEKTVEDVLKIITSGINAKLTERGDKILIVPADEKKTEPPLCFQWLCKRCRE